MEVAIKSSVSSIPQVWDPKHVTPTIGELYEFKEIVETASFNATPLTGECARTRPFKIARLSHFNEVDGLYNFVGHKIGNKRRKYSFTLSVLKG